MPEPSNEKPERFDNSEKKPDGGKPKDAKPETPHDEILRSGAQYPIDEQASREFELQVRGQAARRLNFLDADEEELKRGGANPFAARIAENNRRAKARRSAEKAEAEAKTFDLEGGTGVTVTLPDGTVVEASGGDYEDTDGISRLGPNSIKRALDLLWPWGAALGALALIAAVLVILNNGNVDTQTLDTPPPSVQEQGSGPTEESSAPVEGPEEPLSSSEQAEAGEILVASLIECPFGLLPDTFDEDQTGGGAGDGVAAETPTSLAFKLQCVGHDHGSHVFTMMVGGDGEHVFTAEGTTFDLRFVVNNQWPDNVFDDDGFMVFVDYNKQFEKYFGNVTDANYSPVSDATVDVVWLEPTTLEVTVSFPGDDIEVRNVRTELIGIIVDDDDTITDEYHDIAIWTDES